MTSKKPRLPDGYDWRDHAGSKYQKRHYEDVARIIREAYEAADRSFLTKAEVVALLAGTFAGTFAADNPLFDRERFLKACGLEE